MLYCKVLGDVFEAIIGAIFVDSAGAALVVTSVIYRLLEREFGASISALPMLILVCLCAQTQMRLYTSEIISN